MHSLIPAYRELHKAGKFPGFSIAPYLPRIDALVSETGAQSLLDYGCGEGKQYTFQQWHRRWGMMPTLYDPAVAGLDTKPAGQFDGVICTDVLEHVPEAELDAVIADIRGYARLWCFISVCCRPAKPNKNLPTTGANAHVTVKPEVWWVDRLSTFFDRLTPRLVLEFTP